MAISRKQLQFFIQQTTVLLFTKQGKFSEPQGLFLFFQQLCGSDPASKPVLLMGSLLIQCFCHQPDLAAFYSAIIPWVLAYFHTAAPNYLIPLHLLHGHRHLLGLLAQQEPYHILYLRLLEMSRDGNAVQLFILSSCTFSESPTVHLDSMLSCHQLLRSL